MLLQTEDPITGVGLELGLGVAVFILALIAFTIYKREKTRLLLYFSLAWMCLAMFFMSNLVIASLLDSVLIYQLSYILFLPATLVFWFSFVDETMHESIGLKKMVVAFTVCTFVATFAIFEPWTYDPSTMTFSVGEPIDWWFFQSFNIIILMMSVSYAYWTIITFKEAPLQLKGKSRILFIMGVFMIVGAIIQFTADSTMLLVQSIIILVTTAITLFVIKKEPRIVHLLPYRVYRLLITSANGAPYYSKTWTKIDPDRDLDDAMFAGLMSAIRTTFTKTVKDAFDTGSVSEVRMDKAVMLTETHYAPISIMLLTSKASTALKKAMFDFGSAFSRKYYDALYDKDGFALDVVDTTKVFKLDEMEYLVSEFFGNVPSFLESRDRVSEIPENIATRLESSIATENE